jgi:hypothetical protein
MKQRHYTDTARILYPLKIACKKFERETVGLMYDIYRNVRADLSMLTLPVARHLLVVRHLLDAHRYTLWF